MELHENLGICLQSAAHRLPMCKVEINKDLLEQQDFWGGPCSPEEAIERLRTHAPQLLEKPACLVTDTEQNQLVGKIYLENQPRETPVMWLYRDEYNRADQGLGGKKGPYTMLQGETEIFTNHRSIIALFRQLQRRDPQQPWSLLPILTILGPEGSGKSALLRYMCFRLCYRQDGSPAQPYAFLDFSQPDAKTSLLPILVALRNQLQQHGGGKVTFPRFDLGALIALTTPSEEDLLQNPDNIDISTALEKATKCLELINGISSSLGDLIPFLKPIVAVLKLVQETPGARSFFLRLERGKALEWYQTDADDYYLKTSTDIGGVLLRLQALSTWGSPTRTQTVIEKLLPKAFLADLCECMQDSETSAVVFLDSFEVLLNKADTGFRLLEIFTEQRTSGQTDPLLFVIGTRPPFSGIRPVVVEEGGTPQEAQKYLTAWRQQLPTNKSFLNPADLCLLLELPHFQLADTQYYLEHYLQQRGLPTSTINTQLVKAIHEFTNGYPSYVAFVANAILEAKARGREIPPELTGLRISPGKFLPDRLLPEALLSLITKHLSPSERDELVFCAVPRSVDATTLGVVLNSPTDLIAKERWDYYLNNFAFVHPAADKQQFILLASIRDVLLQQLSDNDYNRIHQRLQEHFHARAERGDEQAQIEEAYHGLARGDSEPAVHYAIAAHQYDLALWKPLLQAIAEAPTRNQPPDVEQRAADALAQAKQHKDSQYGITAIALYTWLLNSSKNAYDKAHRQHYLGDAYSSLPSGDRQVNLQKAIEYYEASLALFTPEGFPDDWSETQNDLGNIYSTLQMGDRQANLEQAVTYYQKALKVRKGTTYPRGWAETHIDLAAAYWAMPREKPVNLKEAEKCLLAALDCCTPEIFSRQWAKAQHWLGNVYLELPTATERQENLKKAIEFYRKALHVYTQEKDLSADWAEIQLKLATVYSHLQDPSDRQANLKQAIDNCAATLNLYTREAFPRDWAFVQRNLGSIYCELPEGNRDDNVKRAIASCENALQIYTREAFPEDWAEAQNNLGIAYWTLPTGDRQANLQKAMKCHEYALTVYTQETFPHPRPKVLHRLGNVYRDLPSGDRQNNIQKALQHYDEALQRYTRADFPYEFARVQADRGIAYWLLPTRDREFHLKQATQYYEVALEIYTPKYYHNEWAMVQHHLGNAYRDWPSGDRRVNLQQAMRCYEAALEVRKCEIFPIDWAETQRELGLAYWQRGDRQKAMECYKGASAIYQSMHIDDKMQKIA